MDSPFLIFGNRNWTDLGTGTEMEHQCLAIENGLDDQCRNGKSFLGKTK